MATTIPGLRPGEVRRGSRAEKRLRRNQDRHPYVLTSREFGQGLKRSGRTGGQNFRAAATRRYKAQGLQGADLMGAVGMAIQNRRQQRSQIRSSGVSAAYKRMAL